MAPVSASSVDSDRHGSDLQVHLPKRKRGRYVSIANGEISVRLVSTETTADDDPAISSVSCASTKFVKRRLDMAGEVVAAATASRNRNESPSSLDCETGNRQMHSKLRQGPSNTVEDTARESDNDRRRHRWSTSEAASKPMSPLKEAREVNLFLNCEPNERPADTQSTQRSGNLQMARQKPPAEGDSNDDGDMRLHIPSRKLEDSLKQDRKEGTVYTRPVEEGSRGYPIQSRSREVSSSRYVSMTGNVVLRGETKIDVTTDDRVAPLPDSEDVQSLKTFKTASSTTLTHSLNSDLHAPFCIEDDEDKLLVFHSGTSRDSSTNNDDSLDDHAVSRWLDVSREIEDATTDGSLSTNNGAIVFDESKRRTQSRQAEEFFSDLDTRPENDEDLALNLTELGYINENSEPTFRKFDSMERKRPSYLDIMIEDEGSIGDEDLSYRTTDDVDAATAGASRQRRNSGFFRKSHGRKKRGSALLRITRWNESDIDLEAAVSSDTNKSEHSENSGESGRQGTPSLSEYLERNSPSSDSNRQRPLNEYEDSTLETEDLNRLAKICRFARWLFRRNEMACLVVVVILLAKAYPPLGAEYFKPDISSSWICVILIFGKFEYFPHASHHFCQEFSSRSLFSSSLHCVNSGVLAVVLAGLGLKTEQFSRAFQRLPFNLFVQCWSLCIDSVYVYGLSRGLVSIGVLDSRLADGMTICSCLPMTISSVTVMTKASKGDEAAAVFNCAFGNVLGVFISPVLIFAYVGSKNGDLNLGQVLFKLAMRVVVPVILGQCLQKKSKFAVEFIAQNKRIVLKVQMYILLFIV